MNITNISNSYIPKNTANYNSNKKQNNTSQNNVSFKNDAYALFVINQIGKWVVGVIVLIAVLRYIKNRRG